MVNRLYLYLAWTVLLLAPPLARGMVGYWANALIILVSALYLAILAGEKRDDPRFRATAIGAPAAVFLAMAAVSMVFSVYKHDSIFAFLRMLSYAGIYFFCVSGRFRPLRNYTIAVVIAAGAGVSIITIFQAAGLVAKSWWVPVNLPAGTFVCHNHLAGYLEMAIPLTAGAMALFAYAGLTVRIMLAAALGVMVTAFILSQSRGGWLSLGLAITIMAVISSFRSRRRVRLFLLVLFLITAALFASVRVNRDIETRVSSMTNPDTEDCSWQMRLMIWRGALGMIKDAPLTGAGPGAFDRAFYRYRPGGFAAKAVYAHNDYLQAASELGLPCFLLLAWMALLILRQGASKGRDLFIASCMTGFVCLLIHGMFDFNFQITSNMILFTVCAGLIVEPREDEPG